jgi:hypothetical protein
MRGAQVPGNALQAAGRHIQVRPRHLTVGQRLTQADQITTLRVGRLGGGHIGLGLPGGEPMAFPQPGLRVLGPVGGRNAAGVEFGEQPQVGGLGLPVHGHDLIDRVGQLLGAQRPQLALPHLAQGCSGHRQTMHHRRLRRRTVGTGGRVQQQSHTLTITMATDKKVSGKPSCISIFGKFLRLDDKWSDRLSAMILCVHICATRRRIRGFGHNGSTPCLSGASRSRKASERATMGDVEIPSRRTVDFLTSRSSTR